MKARIFVDGRGIYNSNKVSKKNLEKIIEKLKREYRIFKMEDQVKRGFEVFTSKY